MYKSKLQELCQRRSWELPEYTTVKDGPDHMPRFTAAVNVHGQVFETPAHCKSAKEAQNNAAQIAFDHFNVPPPPAVNHLPPSTLALAAVNSTFHAVRSDAPLPIAPPVAPPPEMQPVAAVPPLLPLSPLPSSLPIPPLGNYLLDLSGYLYLHGYVVPSLETIGAIVKVGVEVSMCDHLSTAKI